jgi:uncharacterized protein YecT (DUF1311 family)
MIVALLIALAGMQAAADDPIETACYKQDESQQGMNRCAGEAYERADTALNAQWQKVIARYSDDAEAKALLLNGQREWLKYRDAQCEIAAFDNRGGSIWPLINSGCLARLTRERAAELADLLAGEGN